MVKRVAPNARLHLHGFAARIRAGAAYSGCVRAGARVGGTLPLALRDHRPTVRIGSSPVFPSRRQGLWKSPSRQGCISSWISPSPPSDEERAGERVRFYWFPLPRSSPTRPRGRGWRANAACLRDRHSFLLDFFRRSRIELRHRHEMNNPQPYKTAPKELFGKYEGAVFGKRPRWRGATKENIPGGSSTEGATSQTAFSRKPSGRRVFVRGRVGSYSLQPLRRMAALAALATAKSLAAAPFVVCKQALTPRG